MKLTHTLTLPGGPETVVLLIIAGIPMILMIIALIDVLRSEFKDSNNKLVWLLVVILLPLLGSLLYFLIGRNQRR